MNEDELYAKAFADVNEGKVVTGIWAKAFALADGEPNKAKAKYIALWVQSQLARRHSERASASDQRHYIGPKKVETVAPIPQRCPKCQSHDWKLCSVVSPNGKTELSRLAVRPNKPAHSVVHLQHQLRDAKREMHKYMSTAGAKIETVSFLGLKVQNPGARIQDKIDGIKAQLAQHERHEDWAITRICMRCASRFVLGKQSPEATVDALFSRISVMNPEEEQDRKEEEYRKRIGLD